MWTNCFVGLDFLKKEKEMKKKLMVAVLAASLMIPGEAEAGLIKSVNKKIEAVGDSYSKVSPVKKLL